MFKTSIHWRNRHGPLAAAILFCLNGPCVASAAESEPLPAVSAASYSGPMTLLPFDSIGFDLLVDDVNGDQRADVAMTSHTASYTQIFYQGEPRTFSPGPRIDSVGFHPGDLLRLPGDDPRLYLMNAEGINRLQVYQPADDGGLRLISEMGAPAPRVATSFHWPDWGNALAIGPFASSMIILFKHFDPLTGRHGGGAELPFLPGVAFAHSIEAGDLDGNGSDELLFANTLSNDIMVVRAPAQPNQAPQIEHLWKFNPGGRVEHLFARDIDQDGDLDVIAPDATDKRPLNRTEINLLLNNGKGQFDLISLVFPCRPSAKGGMSGIQAFDAARDRDGVTYLLAAGYESLALYRVPAGWSGEQHEMRQLPFKGKTAIAKLLLRDVDGDGWLDAVMTYRHSTGSGAILYGPLWTHLGKAVDAGERL